MIRALILAIVLFLIGTTIAINNYIKTQNQVSSSKETFQSDEFHVPGFTHNTISLEHQKLLTITFKSSQYTPPSIYREFKVKLKTPVGKPTGILLFNKMNITVLLPPSSHPTGVLLSRK